MGELPRSDDDAQSGILERRWFAAMSAASAARSECEVLLEAIAEFRARWSEARTRLLHLERVRDSLGEEIALADAGSDRPVPGGAPFHALDRCAAA
ncbi:MAG: hypothetical protein KGL34_10735 [Gammaproteobacteria bacterium]|nr:hypothetical protein [Gammaproteobacteria bacterium]